MAVPTFMQGVQMSFLDTATRARHKVQLDAAKTQTAAADPSKSADPAKTNSGFTFNDALDIINPLQHIPIVSTIYRALTGDTIKPLERLAGDTLYGGVPGFLSSAANLAFENFTGKDFGDTAMAWLGVDGTEPQTAIAAVDITPAKTLDGQKPVTVAANTPVKTLDDPKTVATAANTPLAAPVTTQPANATPVQSIAMDSQNLAALTQSMLKNGIDSDLGLRAVTAYQKMLNDPKIATQPPLSLH